MLSVKFPTLLLCFFGGEALTCSSPNVKYFLYHCLLANSSHVLGHSSFCGPGYPFARGLGGSCYRVGCKGHDDCVMADECIVLDIRESRHFDNAHNVHGVILLFIIGCPVAIKVSHWVKVIVRWPAMDRIPVLGITMFGMERSAIDSPIMEDTRRQRSRRFRHSRSKSRVAIVVAIIYRLYTYVFSPGPIASQPLRASKPQPANSPLQAAPSEPPSAIAAPWALQSRP